MKFAMSDEEIIRNYKNAENFKDQVRILAELNAVLVQDMARKMKDLGLEVDMRWYAQTPKDEKKTTNVPAVDVEQHLNNEINRLRDELMKLREMNARLSELHYSMKARVEEVSKLRRIITILMEEP